MKDRKNLEKIICYSAVVILAAQLSMNLFIADFKISIAVVFIPLFYFLTAAFPLLPVTFCSAFGVSALRACTYRLQTKHCLRVSGNRFLYLLRTVAAAVHGVS